MRVAGQQRAAACECAMCEHRERERGINATLSPAGGEFKTAGLAQRRLKCIYRHPLNASGIW